MSKWREGYTKVFLRGEGHICLLLASFDDFKDSWKSGKTFWDGPQLYGGYVVIKLSEVQGVILCTAESIANEDADDKSEKNRKLVNGDD